LNSPPPAAESAGYICRHGATRHLGVFTPSGCAIFPRGSEVVVRTDRGQEIGNVLCTASPRAVEQIAEPTRGQILRPINDDDRKRLESIREQQRTEYEVGARLIGQRRLQMSLVDVEHLFGGERVIFYFLADKRVDFRDLVKDLARELQSRIELRQIGPRDEAKLKADYGDCGKPVCCNTHMAVLPPVSMRMAKLQKSTLDPSKISGRCGRLKCCLRFEQDVYEELQKDLPPVGARIVTNRGQGRVLAQEILARRLLIEFEDGRRLPVPMADVLTTLRRTPTTGENP
jgi:cell fate regulator YaaT (PSP1 superfamily)